MQLNPVPYGGLRPIEGYGPGFFRIGGEIWRGPVLACADRVQAWGGFEDIESLQALAPEIDVLFVGTGTDIAPIPGPFRTALEQAGLGVEMMASPTACRSYNVLLSEGRRVAVALLPVA
ncbi:MAG: Mth938-like domain-containing protein [Alkalilacustris sp.]